MQKHNCKQRHKTEESQTEPTKPVYYQLSRNTLPTPSPNPCIESDDSSDCSNAETKLCNYYTEARDIEHTLLNTKEEKDKEIKFKSSIKSVIRLEFLRRKIAETNGEKLARGRK
jgi:hypothetical protein